MEIFRIVVVVLAVLILLVLSEMYWRFHKQHGEVSRKFVHITVGSFVATWPFFLSWGQIQFLSLAFLLSITISRYFKVFQAIHSVQRPTAGEYFFAAAVGATTLITQDAYIFAAALLHMSLADGFAAIIGTKFGKANRFTVKGHHKSVAGSLTFVVVSLMILGVYGILAGVTLSPGILLATAVSTAAIEAAGILGIDNLLVPVLVAVILQAA